MRKIVVFKEFQPAEKERLLQAAGDCEIVFAGRTDRKTEKELLRDALICIGEPARQAIAESSTLKLVQMTWAGTDFYTRAAEPFPEGVFLCNASGAFGIGMAQYALGAVLSLYRRFPQYQNNKREHRWHFEGIEKSVIGTSVLIYGAGDIGTCTAKLFRAMGASQIIGVRRNPQIPEGFDAVCTLAEAEEYLPGVDIVIGCMPNTDDNQGYLNSHRLARMKKDAVLVNVGRGPFIDNLALAAALNRGDLFGAALDVTSPEPLPADHPLWDCGNLILTPHVAGPSFGNPQIERLLTDICCENIRRYLAGEPLVNRIY